MPKGNEIVEDPNYQLKTMIVKLQLFGKPYKSGCGHEYYVIENSDTTIVYIPDDVEYLMNTPLDKPDFCNINCKLLKVIGGSGLIYTYHMFYRCEAQSIDLSLFDTSNITSMNSIFTGCKTKSLDLSSFDTSNVTDMGWMFTDCEAQSLNLSSFDTSKVTDMECMFSHCKVQSLDLSSFDTTNVTNMSCIFYACEAQVKTTDRRILEELSRR